VKRQPVVEFSVKVHTCRLLQDYGPGTLEEGLIPNNRYICVRNLRRDEGEAKPYLEEVSKEPEYYQMRPNCKCRKWITFREAIDLCDSGHALWAFKTKNHEVERCEPDPPRRNSLGMPIRGALGHIWRPVVVGKVPRIDLITKADIERAYVDLTGTSIKKIEMIHEMHMEARALLFYGLRLEDGEIVDNKDGVPHLAGNQRKVGVPIQGVPDAINDPQEGRCLFPFSPDERTKY
jgi:hypothetical protein